MRIIKNIGDAIAIIAGEMLNFELAELCYIDGCEVNEKGPAYPTVTSENTVYTIQPVCGVIFIPVDMDIEKVEYVLMNMLKRLELSRKPHQRIPLANYQSIGSSVHTNVKIASSCTLTAGWGQKTNNVLRMFTRGSSSAPRGVRFTWSVMHIHDFDGRCDSSMPHQAITNNIVSIFYDFNNICVLAHNTITFEFGPQHMCGYENVTTERIKLIQRGGLSGTGLLMAELSPHWREQPWSTLHNIPAEKVFTCDFKALQFVPITISDTSPQTVTDICSKCRSPLYDDIYALAEPINNPVSTTCVAMCALCLHTCSREHQMDAIYRRILRITYPRTSRDIAMMESNIERRNLLLEALYGIKFGHSEGVDYVLFGNKYVGFSNINEYLYRGFAKKPIFAGRKVCIYGVI